MFHMQQDAIRWQSKTYCKNLACRAGTTLGLVSPARESRYAGLTTKDETSETIVRNLFSLLSCIQDFL